MKLKRLLKLTGFSLAGCIALFLLLMLAVKITLDRAPRYQAEIKEWVHKQTGYHVSFAHVSPSFRWYGPELYFDRLELRSKDDQRVLARAAGGRIAADIWRLLSSGKLLAGHIELDAPAFDVVRLDDSRFAIATEIEFNNEGDGSASLKDLPSGTLAIRRATVTLRGWNAQLPALALKDVNLDFTHEKDVQLVLSAQLPAELGNSLTVRAQAAGPGSLKQLDWSGIAHVRGLSFPGWRELLPEYLGSLNGGVATFDLRAAGAGSALSLAELNFAATQVAMQLPDAAPAKFDQMSGVVTLTHGGERWHLTGRRVRAARRDPESEFDVDWTSGSGPQALDVRASYLRMETLLPLTGLLPQKELRDRLREIAPTGEWFDTKVRYARASADAQWQMDLKAHFRNAGFAPVGKAPGVRGLSGTLSGNERAGQLVLDTRDGFFNWPRQFPQPIELKTLSGNFFWSRSGEDFLLASKDWVLKTPDGAIDGKVAWHSSADETSPMLTLAANVQSANAAGAHGYFPKAQLAPPAYDWLTRAFQGGRVTRGTMVLNGPLKHFPFRDGSGLFLVVFDVENLKLDYSPGWPQAEIAQGHAVFRNEGLTVHGSGGKVGDMPVGSLEARFADFKTGELDIKAAAHADAESAVAYLAATPLDALADNAFSAVEAHGPLEARIELFFPFKDFVHRRVLVHGHLEDATLKERDLAPIATAVSGDFDVDGAQVAQADLHGQLLGGNFQLQSRAPRNRPVMRTQLELRGTLNADALKSTFALPASVAISGQTDWRAVLKMAPDPARERSLRISSTLAGLALHLPAPLNKPAGTPLASFIEVQWPAAKGPMGTLSIGSLVSGSYALQSEEGGYRLAKLALNFGESREEKGDAQILNVGGSVERVDLAGWLELNKPDKNSKPLSYYLRSAKMDVAELDYLGLAFRDVSLTLSVGDNGMRILVGGPNVTGSINVPSDAAEPWGLEFDQMRFEVAGRDADEGESEPEPEPAEVTSRGFSDPHAIPALNFHAGQLIWGQRRFGDVRASLTKLDDGVRLQTLAVQSPSFNVKAVGEWRGKDEGRARIEGSFTSTDVESTLKDLGYADVMQAKSGKLDFDLNWLGPPTAKALANVAGKVTLAFDKGQLTGIKPGAGRVLGLTSFASLPRRLSLDFSDLTDKGLAFDTVRGDFELHDGNAVTDNVLLKGPAAEIGLIGRVGLKKRDYDQTAVVTGNIGSTLALPALALGPVAAGAVLVFTQLFKQPLKGLTRGYYRITGGWDNPTVERIKGAEAAAAPGEAPSK